MKGVKQVVRDSIKEACIDFLLWCERNEVDVYVKDKVFNCRLHNKFNITAEELLELYENDK